MINWQGKVKLTWRTYAGLILFVLVLFAVVALMIVEVRLAPVLHTWAHTKAVGLATTAINLAVEEVMAGTLDSTALAKLIRDGDGSLKGVQYDMGAVNRVSSQASQLILKNLEDMGQQAFAIPLGQLTGLRFLAAWGPDIPVRMVPVGALTATPMASFQSAGLNQTWHRVLLDIEVMMRVVVPLLAEEIAVSARVPIVEEIFIGDVPSWYFAGQENLTIQEGLLEFPLN
ncbi:MAG: sporulation protein YunB [Limnochordia bacterium]|nr:sporulation protein YunB [Bacillota bacterium]NLL09053.1 sporulation protein YunB [Bacillota bacterium]